MSRKIAKNEGELTSAASPTVTALVDCKAAKETSLMLLCTRSTSQISYTREPGGEPCGVGYRGASLEAEHTGFGTAGGGGEAGGGHGGS